jgi:hypothetical protein
MFKVGYDLGLSPIDITNCRNDAGLGVAIAATYPLSSINATTPDPLRYAHGCVFIVGEKNAEAAAPLILSEVITLRVKSL